MGRGAWQATVHGVTRVRHDLVTKPPPTTHTYILIQIPFPYKLLQKYYILLIYIISNILYMSSIMSIVPCAIQ